MERPAGTDAHRTSDVVLLGDLFCSLWGILGLSVDHGDMSSSFGALFADRQTDTLASPMSIQFQTRA